MIIFNNHLMIIILICMQSLYAVHTMDIIYHNGISIDNSYCYVHVLVRYVLLVSSN